MAKKSTPYHSLLLEDLTDPREAAEYLCESLEDSREMFKKALRNVAQAHTVSRVAQEAGIQRESLYRSFRAEGNPTLDTLLDVLAVFKIRPRFEAKDEVETAPPSTEWQDASGSRYLPTEHGSDD